MKARDRKNPPRAYVSDDIVNEVVTPSGRAARRGVAGAAVIQQRVTELLDVPAIVGDIQQRVA